jgi:hypothetical protein
MRYIFIHIPKAAGSSMNLMLKNHLGKRYHHLNWKKGQQLEKQSNIFANFVRFYRIYVVGGHVNFGIHSRLPGKYRYFSFLRRPDSRVASHYYYALEQPTHYLNESLVKRKMTLSDYAGSDLSLELDNGQVRALANYWQSTPVGPEHLKQARDNILKSFCFLGFQESFSSDVALLFKGLGLGPITVERNNATKMKGEINSQEKEFLLERNRFDFELWTYFQENPLPPSF